ncbi:hypothetical protein ACT2CC_00405 [Candidatus Vidania fulgoroideorum]
MNGILKILKIRKVTNILINKEDIFLFLKLLSNNFKNIYFYSKKYFINNIFSSKKINKYGYIYHIKNNKGNNSYRIYDKNIINKNQFSSYLCYKNKGDRVYIKFSMLKKIFNIENSIPFLNGSFLSIVKDIKLYFMYYSNFIILNPFFLSYKNIEIFSKILYLYNKYKILNVYYFLILIKYERFFIQKI